MSRIACTLFLAAALPLTACSKSTDTAGAAPTPAPVPELATPAGLTNTLTSKLGISESQANAAIGSILGTAQGQLSPEDYSKLSGAIPGADGFLEAATAAGVGPTAEAATGAVTDSIAPIPEASADSASTGAAAADAAAAEGGSVGMDALNSTFSKLGIPPEAAEQFVPVLTDYVGKVGGPDAANIMKGLF